MIEINIEVQYIDEFDPRFTHTSIFIIQWHASSRNQVLKLHKQLHDITHYKLVLEDDGCPPNLEHLRLL